ncbi:MULTISPECIES: copper resistance protein CopC [unclassified Microbacterium]|uniref:copper resistance protein CopC n=1 Tax=unclassified Microbacterium TaxID=2609290 RepID=UPI001D906411|nr:copper resistance protein CopC [uncultured Microbacterium sp.]MBS1898554.1 copper resistance protein CopC [Actinomycetota bacterium]MBS1899747.1 copper resistance protein CopC [Actinomycetota bacterium]
MSTRHRLAALAAAIGIGAVLATGTATAASAHDTLDGTDPAQGSTVTSLSAVSLTFSADPLGTDGATVIQLIGPDKKYYETACPDLNGPVVSSPVALGAAGTYEVLWRVVSSDGHPISGSYTFDYAPGGSATPAAAGSAKPVCGPAASEPSESPAAEASADAGLWIGLGIGAVVLIGVGVGAWALARGRRS